MVQKYLGGQVTNDNSPINIIARKPIAQKSALLLVEVDGIRMLLSQSQDESKLIHVLNSNSGERLVKEVQNENETSSSSFSDVLLSKVVG